MKIIRAQHLGMCFGVRDAIDLALTHSQTEPLTILGDLVHNETVLAELRQRGIRIVNDPSSVDTGSVMITAHGASDKTMSRVREHGLTVVDATCPLVQHAHDALKRLVAAGFFPVVIGKAGHVEVEGLIGDFPDAIVLSSEEDVRRLPRSARYGVISQTTQPIEFVRQVVDSIRQSYPDSDVRFVDTVCKPTKDRQSALRKLIAESDVIVVVGGRTSNNTHQLVATCSATNKIVFHIERAEELRPEWFSATEIIGLTAGTSTLPETVAAVHARLLQIAGERS